MIRCLHTADLHLDARFPSLGDRDELRRADLLKTFERIVTLAIKNEVKLFLLSGDLFDIPQPSATTVARVQAELKRLVDRKIVPVLIPGTHDALASRNSVYRHANFPGLLLTEPEITAPARLEIDGTPVWLYGFAPVAGATESFPAGMRRNGEAGIHIGLLHASRKGSPEWNYRPKDLPFDLDQLQAMNLDYIALGHYHSWEVLHDREGRVVACYPGSPEGKRFGENGPRYCALVEVAAGGGTVVKPLAVQSRTLEERELDLSGHGTVEGVVETILRLADEDLLLRLRLTGTVECPLNISVLLEHCRDRFFHLELIDRTRFFDSDYARRIEHEETVRGLFVRRARKLLQESPPERRAVVEEAFREVLSRFCAVNGRAE